MGERSENPTGKTTVRKPERERSENQTDIQITNTNNILKQQPKADTAVAFERLQSAGFDARAAIAIASQFDLDRIKRQILWIDQRKVRSNRLGMLRVAIEEDWSAPDHRGSGRPPS